jgi:Holliday junction resolvase-like predicted endonuclease
MGDGNLFAEVGIWNVTSGRPRRYALGSVGYEEYLEDWIEQDPSLIRDDLLIVGRQVHLASGVLDLLAVDRTGSWAVIEIKRGNIRRKTVMQAVDYAACVAEMSSDELAHIVDTYLSGREQNLEGFMAHHGFGGEIFEERNVTVFVVGTGRDVHLERMVRGLSFRDQPINIVQFGVFENDVGELLILRRLTEAQSDVAVPAVTTDETDDRQSDMDRLFKLANQNGIGNEFRRVYDAATKHGLYPRLHRWGIMYTPPQNKTRVLICAWVKPNKGRFDIFIAPHAFAEFFPVGKLETRRILGWSNRRRMTPEDVDTFVRNLDALFARIEANS